ncbi:hypothetical protein KCM76_05480 [Zooshikella marina]|uniref:hypothetical protein n=1 Tax=Zooshikella ganghwensis TaxID=202772 RepID=UPI001BB0D172|nr:hypothetical protein [Zooshikella ganghwensis]MBU2705419.1 hypothetical protein [Zooshikella ganghwensis]
MRKHVFHFALFISTFFMSGALLASQLHRVNVGFFFDNINIKEDKTVASFLLERANAELELQDIHQRLHLMYTTKRTQALSNDMLLRIQSKYQLDLMIIISPETNKFIALTDTPGTLVLTPYEVTFNFAQNFFNSLEKAATQQWGANTLTASEISSHRWRELSHLASEIFERFIALPNNQLSVDEHNVEQHFYELSINCQQLQQQSENLVKNGDFNLGTDYWQNAFRNNAIIHIAPNREETPCYNNVARIVHRQHYSDGLQQYVELEPAQQYQLSVSARLLSRHEQHVRDKLAAVMLIELKNGLFDYQFIDYLSITNQEFSTLNTVFTFNPALNQSEIAKTLLLIYGPNPIYDIEIDHVSLAIAPKL